MRIFVIFFALFIVYIPVKGQTSYLSYLFQSPLYREKCCKSITVKNSGVKDFSFDKLNLLLNYSQDHLLTYYSYYLKRTSEDAFYLGYDIDNKLVSINRLSPYEDYIRFYRDSNDLLQTIVSSKNGITRLTYNDDSTLKEIIIDSCSIRFNYDKYGNVVSEDDPCNILYLADKRLTEINNYERLSMEYKGMDTCQINMMERRQVGFKKKTTVVYFKCGENEKLIVSNSEVQLRKKYVSNQECSLAGNSTPIILDLGLQGDILGLTKDEKNSQYQGNAKLRFYVNNVCYKKYLWLNYFDFTGNIAKFDTANSSLKIINSSLSNQDRQSLFQTSYLNLQYKVNLLKVSTKNIPYEFNFEFTDDFSKIIFQPTGQRYTYSTLGLGGQIASQIINTEYFKLNLTLSYLDLIHPADGFLPKYSNNYLVPELYMQLLKSDLLTIKLKMAQQLNPSNNTTNRFYSIQIGVLVHIYTFNRLVKQFSPAWGGPLID